MEAWLLDMANERSTDLALHLRNNLHAVTHPFLLDVVCGRAARWSVPGMLLLGDAAHTMSPVGAQGINMALRDAVVAANHLCEAAAGGWLLAKIAGRGPHTQSRPSGSLRSSRSRRCSSDRRACCSVAHYSAG